LIDEKKLNTPISAQAAGAAMALKPTATLADIRGIAVHEDAVKAHVIRPPHVEGIRSSRGLEEGALEFKLKYPPAPVYHFDVDAFGQGLHAALKNSVAGYVMRLRQHGATIYTLEWNWAKAPADGSEGWQPGVRMHVASVSKLLTAMAMTRVLNEKHISYDAKIIDWLPKYWTKGPHIDQITFRDLMTHRSGFNTGKSDSDFNFMKANVAAGVTAHGSYHYQNMNFGLCRILISTIMGVLPTTAVFSIPFLSNFNDLVWDFTTINGYVDYVQKHVFTPAGVSGPSLDHPGPDALAYTFPPAGGWNSGNLASVSGGAGWHASVDDLLNIMGTFRRGGSIMSTAQAQTMLDSGFGIDLIQSTPLGTLYNKNGLWQDGAGRVEQSLAYFLPQDMELVVLANSPVGNPAQFFRDVVTNLYLANIKP
jgi:CubicO group peptidase (beta-lactamase class C family)